MPLVNLYKGAYDSSRLLELCGVQGNIVFDNNTGRIYAGTTTVGSETKPKMYGSNVQDVTFANNVLTITRIGEANPTTLDFSDIASASQTMSVFQKLEGIMGALNAAKTAPDYTSDTTGILHSSETGATNPATLVAADLALATAIHDRLDGLDATADADTASGTGYATVTTTTPTADFKVLNSVTETDGKLASAEAYQLKKVAATAESTDLYKSTNSAAAYDTTAAEISSTWVTTVNSNALADGDTVDADLNKLDAKIAGLADEVIRDEHVINATVDAIVDSVGLEDDLSLNLQADQTNIISGDTDVKSALLHLAENIENSVDHLDSVVDADDTAAQTGHATITTTTPTADFKVLNSVTQANGVMTAGDAYQLKKVAATAESTDLFKSTNSAAAYDTTASEVSSSWVTTVNSNALADGDTVDADLNKLDAKIAGLADEVIADEQVINATVSAMSDSIGLEDDMSLTLSTASGIISSDTDVKSALIHLASAITGMDSTAVIASKSGDVITLKAGLTQTDGVVANNSGSDITLANVAATGAASDIALADANNHFTTDNAEAALEQLAVAVESLNGSFDVIMSSDAASTPSGVTWDNNGTTVTGTLVASDTTFHKIYLVPGENGTSPNTHREYITTKSTNGQTVTYGWEKLGDIDVDLTGYVKSVTVNGKQYTVSANSTNITLTDVITEITGETAINGWDANLVAVTATTTKNTTTGANATVLASSVKLEEVADGYTQDVSATYAAGHYVIQNGKLVDASDKSSTGLPTYTKSANDGLTTASDVKAYVDSAIQNARMAWAEWS